jgi:hypothetical protein
MSLRQFSGQQPRRIAADQVRAGQWIVDPQNARFDRQVVEAGRGKIDELSVRIRHDYGNGGEPATSFYGPRDTLLVLDQRP